jgi:hypothetical protein
MLSFSVLAAAFGGFGQLILINFHLCLIASSLVRGYICPIVNHFLYLY